MLIEQGVFICVEQRLLMKIVSAQVTRILRKK